MSNTSQTPFFTSLVRATTSALQSAQREFFQEWSVQRQGGEPSAPIKVVPAATAPTNARASTSGTAKSSTVSPERLAYLRSVYLKPPLRPPGGT